MFKSQLFYFSLNGNNEIKIIERFKWKNKIKDFKEKFKAILRAFDNDFSRNKMTKRKIILGNLI